MTAFLSLRDAITKNTGWPLHFADTVEQTPLPTATELAVLRDLHARTEKVYPGKVVPHARTE